MCLRTFKVFLVGPWQLVKTSTTHFYPPQKPAPGIVTKGGNVHRGANRGKDPPNPRHEALCQGLHGTGGGGITAANDSFRAPGGCAGGDFFLHCLWGVHEEHMKQNTYQKLDDELFGSAGRSQFGMPPLGVGTVLAANRRVLRIVHKSRINGHKTSQKCKFIQINLPHIKAELALLC